VAVENASEMKFAAIPDAPSCFTMAVAKGDPDNGPSTLLVKGTAGCDAPMHFHSVTEQLLMVKGTARLQMKGDEPKILRAAAFVTAPPRHPHRATCTTACEFYLISDGPFDIHYVDSDGNEISLEQAVKILKKRTRGK
jgi:quercetin dioxygenase-like cupin family protein